MYRIAVPYAQKDPRFPFEKRRGQPREFWSLVSTIDGSALPQVGVEELLCGTPSIPGKSYKLKKKKKKLCQNRKYEKIANRPTEQVMVIFFT